MGIKLRHKSFILLITTFLLVSCEKNDKSEITVKLKNDYLKEQVWLSVDKRGEPKISDHQKCTLFFLNNNEYEIRKTFEYSGSTFRNPGIYVIQDSLIQLRSLDGTDHLGNVYIHQGSRLKVEWFESELTYGEGIDIFKPL